MGPASLTAPSFAGTNKTALSELVRTGVDKALKADLAEVKEEERQRFREAVRAHRCPPLLADNAARHS